MKFAACSERKDRMLKWYDMEGANQDIVVASRIRLQRNLKEYPFPVKLNKEETVRLNAQLTMDLAGIQTVTAQDYDVIALDGLSDRARTALQERQLISHGIAQKKTPVSIMLSKDESVGIIMNGEDHLRLQISKSGLNLEGAWAKADQIDDLINEKYEYAFDPKYGYMTTYPTHLGTGMRAYLIVHIPIFSASKKFKSVMNEMGRFGIVFKNAFGGEDENYGDIYVLYNQKTLGQSEQEIIALVNKVGKQVMEQENRLRGLSLKNQKAQREDQSYRAYGILKYARSLTFKDALLQLSRLRLGISMGLLNLKDSTSIFQLMQCCQPATLQTMYHKELGEEELNRLRAEYIRSCLPMLKEETE